MAAPASADDDHDHGHADAIIWDGNTTEDCSIADPGTIVGELTETEEAGYVELHIDEPEDSVTPVDDPPHVWVSELFPLEEIATDADNIHGDLGEGAALLATFCPAVSDDPVDAPVGCQPPGRHPTGVGQPMPRMAWAMRK
ncbi:MAG: hypothetical protein EA388_13390 [Nitriliruptor sp.]|nr:MAG: hypothetical protein EA388_13390 [Nitriliruptor sp.]